MFFDWLSCYQDYPHDLPIIAKQGYAIFNFEDGSFSPIRQAKVHHEGSFSTSIQVKVTHNRIAISGNPSRFNRLDNLVGLPTLEQCIAVYNDILASLGLPSLTRCRFISFIDKPKSEAQTHKLKVVADGCVITEIHLTSNVSVGQGCEQTYLKALSMLPYKNSVPRLHTDGNTTDWLSKLGKSRLEYPKVYNKAHEIRLHALPEVKRKYGEDTQEYGYMLDLVHYCEALGVVRFEQKLRSPFLTKHNLQYWGLSDYSQLKTLHDTFKSIDKKLKVSHMNLQTISETLLNEHIVETTRAANTTALYALNWMNGQHFDMTKKQVQTHRARLRQIGIDIAKPCNLLTFSPVILKETIEIEKKDFVPPPFYRYPKANHIKLVA
jgi:hypothetical protein